VARPSPASGGTTTINSRSRFVVLGRRLALEHVDATSSPLAVPVGHGEVNCWNDRPSSSIN